MAAPTPAQHHRLEIEDKHADEDEMHVFNTYQQLLNQETSPYQAAQTVDQITFGPESRIAEFYRKDFPWPLLLKAVEQTPIDSQKVFIQFATILDTLGPWNGSVATRIGDAVYETWHRFILAEDSSGTQTASHETRLERWKNLHGFVAQLAATQTQEEQWSESVLIPLVWALRDALEGETAHMHTNKPQPDERIDWGDKVAKCQMDAALIVLDRGGGKALCDHRSESWSHNNEDVRGGILWAEACKSKGPEGKEDRWKFWKQRFSDISRNERVPPATRAQAGEGEDLMEQIEKQCSA